MDYAGYLFLVCFPRYLRILFLCLMPFRTVAQLDPAAPECYPGGHRTLNNPYRSVDFDSTELQNTAIQELICDHSLAQGWYRFSINNKPAEMPTSCVEMNRCGTQAPVWLSLRDGPLPGPGQVRQLSACATWQFYRGSAKDCCLFRIPVSVRHCGDFLLYYLQPTQGCMGYCAKVVSEFTPKSCPPGEVEINGRCKGDLPPLSSRPVIVPELAGDVVRLRCSFSAVPASSGPPLGYLVVWARHVSPRAKAQIHRETTLRPFSLVDMDGLQFRLGETFSCSVSTFRGNSSHTRSSPKESEGFYAGIKFSPDVLHVAEDGKEHQLTIHSTVPVPCLGPRCGVPLSLTVHQPDSLGLEAPNLALSACQVELQAVACRENGGGGNGGGGCGQASLWLAAVTDFTRDGQRPSLLSVRPGADAPPLWRRYSPAPLKVTVQDVPTASCYSLTDPHIITLDGRRYENQQTGTFVLYRSLTRDFEVQSRQWDCGSRHHAVACNCGVAAREGGKLVIFDMCNGQLQETRPRLTLRNGGDDSPANHIKILESHQGRKVTLMFPSGAFVRADVSDWGMSVSVRAPGVDYGGTRGLCGTFDRNAHNDFHAPDGTAYGSQDHQHFIDDWRIAPGESLFDAPPLSGVKPEKRRPFCQCHSGYSMSLHAPGSADRLFDSSPQTDCLSYDNVDYTSVFPSVDTTVEHEESAEEAEPDVGGPSVLGTSALPGMNQRSQTYRGSGGDAGEMDREFKEDFLVAVEDRPKRQALYEFQPLFTTQSLSQTDLESLAYFFPDDHVSGPRPAAVRPVWPTPSGLTSAKALELCQLALANSSVGGVCRGVLGRRLDEAVDLCMLDLQLKDDLSWEEALLPYLENECERRLLENRTMRSLELAAGPRGAAGDLVMALRCPSFCNGNGRCTEWGCQCDPGHSSHDCSLASSQPVELTDLENSGLCDIQTFNCRAVRVFGLGFVDSPDLSCLATRLTYASADWVPMEKQRTRATFLSSRTVDCALPPLGGADHALDFMVDDRPYARWEIKVTNDGSQYSQAKVLTIYDGVCQVCEASGSGLCKLKERTCNIDGMCFSKGDSNPTSPCLLCDPSISKFTWSLNQVNQPPALHRPPGGLHAFAGESFVFQLAAADPEGSALLFQLEAGPPDATLSPAGLLIWRVRPGETRRARSFTFTLSDECNAQSRHTVEISVKPCGCSNGGTCVTNLNVPAGGGDFLCTCPEGFRGDLCEESADACLSGPCGAGACVTTADGFRCQCPEGLTGATCVEDVNECEKHPCFPGVRCSNSFGSYWCAGCPQGMLGDGTICAAAPQTVTPGPNTSVTVSMAPRVEVHPPPPARTAAARPRLPQGVATTAIRMPVLVLPPGHGRRASPGPAPGPNATASCAGRPCFPGVLCVDRRPPHVGYACGRCPPGLYGNGRSCTRAPPAAVPKPPRLPARAGHSGPQSGRGRVTQVHLPALPASSSRHAVQRPSTPAAHYRSPARHAAVTSAARAPAAATERRRAVTLPYGHASPASSSSFGALRVAAVTTLRVTPRAAAVGLTRVTAPGRSAAGRAGATRARQGLDHLATPALTAARTLLPKAAPAPLTAAVSSLSYSLFLSEDDSSSADGPPPPPVQTLLTAAPPGTRFSPQRGRHQHVITPPERPLSCAGRPCFPGVPCEPAGGGHAGVRCGRCPVGYTGDGRACRAVCRHACGRNMECAAPDTCRCKAGYTGNDCQTALCQSECGNGGRCVAPDVCECTRGFHGDACQEALCRRPCEHGGTCVGPQTCSCPYGFVGPRCETMVCNRHCHNGGECVSPDECRCPPGWTGPSCETALCSPVCLNGGTCLPGDACVCPPGFYGTRCQNAVCRPPCKNGGVCVRDGVCSCPEGYAGPRCERSVCEPSCMNGGRCVGPDVCDCPSGWRGRLCDKPACLHKCLNGGECVGPNTCLCSPAWQGMLCQIPVCEQSCRHGSQCVRPNVCACRNGYSGPRCSRKLSAPRG